MGLNSGKMRELVKKYGRTGLVTYLSLSTMVTTGKRVVCVLCACCVCVEGCVQGAAAAAQR
jgi:hypothetical protein